MGSRTNNSDVLRRVGQPRATGFSLLEVLTALAILGLISSSVLLVVSRCVASAANSALRMEAFELARENLEETLASDSVSETVEYGISEKYPDISWQTVVEAFPEPVTGQMWVRAVCTAQYVDTAGETQTIKLEHWLTELTDQQANQLVQQDDLEQLAAEQLLESSEEAAQYAGITEEVLEEWVENGLLLTEDGAFIRYNLDLFMQSNGAPTAQDKARQVKSIQELALALRTEQGKQERMPDEGSDGKDPTTGLPYEELEKMDVGEVMNLLQERQRQR